MMTGAQLHPLPWTIRDGRRCCIAYCCLLVIVDHHYFNFSYHCAIEDDDEVVLTGGADSASRSLVTRYTVEGEATSLPFLITGRQFHACGTVTTSDQKMVSMG